LQVFELEMEQDYKALIIKVVAKALLEKILVQYP
jgi:hypothetical protein